MSDGWKPNNDEEMWGSQPEPGKDERDFIKIFLFLVVIILVLVGGYVYYQTKDAVQEINVEATNLNEEQANSPKEAEETSYKKSNSKSEDEEIVIKMGNNNARERKSDAKMVVKLEPEEKEETGNSKKIRRSRNQAAEEKVSDVDSNKETTVKGPKHISGKTLSKAEITAVLKNAKPKFDNCARTYMAEGTIKVAFGIKSDGKVENARCTMPEFEGTRPAECVLEVISSLQFPEHDQITIPINNYPIYLRP